jgi:beta-lactam-binding protein with PASTA domain
MKIAIAAASGFLLGVVLVLLLGAGDDAKTKTVTVPAGGGTVVVTVPQLVGQPLDVAHERTDRSGFDLAVDSGGGVFGILIESSWKVVDQNPEAGTKALPGSTVHVDIERR